MRSASHCEVSSVSQPASSHVPHALSLLSRATPLQSVGLYFEKSLNILSDIEIAEVVYAGKAYRIRWPQAGGSRTTQKKTLEMFAMRFKGASSILASSKNRMDRFA